MSQLDLQIVSTVQRQTDRVLVLGKPTVVLLFRESGRYANRCPNAEVVIQITYHLSDRFLETLNSDILHASPSSFLHVFIKILFVASLFLTLRPSDHNSEPPSATCSHLFLISLYAIISSTLLSGVSYPVYFSIRVHAINSVHFSFMQLLFFVCFCQVAFITTVFYQWVLFYQIVNHSSYEDKFYLLYAKQLSPS